METDWVTCELNEAMAGMNAYLPAMVSQPGPLVFGVSRMSGAGQKTPQIRNERVSRRTVDGPVKWFRRDTPPVLESLPSSETISQPPVEPSTEVSETHVSNELLEPSRAASDPSVSGQASGARERNVTGELQELIQRSEELRKALAETSAEVDAQGVDLGDNLRQIAEADIYHIHVPERLGGLSTGALKFGFQAIAEILTTRAAGEGSTGMIYTVQTAVMHEIFSPHPNLLESTLRQLAYEISHKNARFVSSNAETGTSGHVMARKVSGGINELTGKMPQLIPAQVRI